MALQNFLGLGGDGLDNLVLLIVIGEEVVNQRLDGVLALPQGRHVEFDDAQPVIQVLAKEPLLHLLAQLQIGSGDDPYIGGFLLHAAHGEICFFLHQLQELALEAQGQGADFIQKQRAAVGGFHQADLAFLTRAGEGAGDIAKQLGLNQILRDGGTVDGDERGAGPPAGGVDIFGQHGFSSSGLAADQDGGVKIGDPADGFQDSPHPPVGEDHIFGGLPALLLPEGKRGCRQGSDQLQDQLLLIRLPQQAVSALIAGVDVRLLGRTALLQLLRGRRQAGNRIVMRSAGFQIRSSGQVAIRGAKGGLKGKIAELQSTVQ